MPLPARNASVAPSRSTASSTASISSRELLKGNKTLWIMHGDQRYQLRRTANDKLILTK